MDEEHTRGTITWWLLGFYRQSYLFICLFIYCITWAFLSQFTATKRNDSETKNQKKDDFEVEDDDVDIENELWATSIAHGDEEDAISALLSLAGWVSVVEEDVD